MVDIIIILLNSTFVIVLLLGMVSGSARYIFKNGMHEGQFSIGYDKYCRAKTSAPDGVINIITGACATDAALAVHPDVDEVAFTGSTEVGCQIYRAIAVWYKKLILELGSKLAVIVFDDVDLDSVI